MSSLDGKLVASYETHCPICEKPALGLGRTKKAAAIQLRKDGWREHNALGWMCESCAAKVVKK